MLVHAYLRDGNVYVPTVVRLQTGAYMDVEPVAVVPAINGDALRGALAAAVGMGNAVVPNPPKDKWPPPILLKYARVRSWSVFTRGASLWSIEESGGNYRIIGFRIHSKGYWQQDPEQVTNFAEEATVNDVVNRAIEIIQHAAQQQAHR